MDERTGAINRRDDSSYDGRDNLPGEPGYSGGLPGEPGYSGGDSMLYRQPEDTYDTDTLEADTEEVSDDNTQAIREEIELTRADLADTINEIQERLNPQVIVEQAKESAKTTAEDAIDHAKQAVHDATIGKVENMVSNVSDSVQETGSGIMGLITNN